MLTLIVHGSRLADNNACNQALEIIKAHVGDRKDVHLILPNYEEISGVVGKIDQWARILCFQVSYFDPKRKDDGFSYRDHDKRGATMFLFPVKGRLNEVAARLNLEAMASHTDCRTYWLESSFHG